MSKIMASSKSATFKSDKRSIHTKINNYKYNYIGVHMSFSALNAQALIGWQWFYPSSAETNCSSTALQTFLKRIKY